MLNQQRRASKRTLTAILALTCTVTIGVTIGEPVQVQAAANIAYSNPVFKDIQNHWAKDAIERAARQGIVNGYPDDTFRPDQTVSEPEFLAMLFKAYPGAVPASAAEAVWYEPYYQAAGSYGWPVIRDFQGSQFNRGHVARILAASQGSLLNTDEAIQLLLDRRLANGKTASTVAGFAAKDKLTRAEALMFINNLLDKNAELHAAQKAPSAVKRDFQVSHISLGDSERSVIEKHGQPDRKDTSEYGFEWYVYNRDYANYRQIGVKSGKVVALFSASDNWSTAKGVELGSDSSQLASLYGQPLEGLLKGNVKYLFSETKTEKVYAVNDAYVTFFLDQHDQHRIMAVHVVEKAAEDSSPMKSKVNASLVTSLERQIFDISNAARVKHGLKPFIWDDQIAGTARKHSDDMAGNNYFDHSNLKGESPFDRMKADQIRYSLAAENIAAGQRNAIYAVMGWMNSAGHRKNLLGNAERLGVGVAAGGEMGLYYTQNFYTPMK